MTFKYRAAIIGAVALAALGVLGYLRPTSQPGIVVAKATDQGIEVPNTNGKVMQYQNGVFRVEPDNFAVTGDLKDLPNIEPTSGENAKMAEQMLEEMRKKRANDERIAKGLPPMTEEELEKWEINEQNAERVKRVDPNAGLANKDFQDPLLAKSRANAMEMPQTMPTPSLTFDGAGMADNSSAGAGTGFTPPDVNGDVGPNHYVSSINLVLKIFNKDGSLAAAPKKTSDLFSALPAGDPCRTRNDGDPVVVYDSLADRWVVTQFSLPAGISGSGSNNYECVAVSTTADPTGSYYVWSYIYPGNALNDYPKIGVWTDAYHMTFNQFNNAGTSFLGMGIMSQDRTKALVGDPTTSVVYKNIATIDPNAGGALPADIDGFVPPPAGMAELFAEFRADEFGSSEIDGIRYYKWVPNFTTPASSTLTVLPDVPLAAFDARSPSSIGAVEVSGGASLDGIGDRMMHRFAYRNLGTAANPVNSYVGNFTVNVSGVNPTSASTYQTGIRWFEMRRTNDTLTVNDQGTHATGAISGSTGLNNWMGSIAQDNQGNIALGFSQASSTQKADIKIAGRTGSPSGTMNEGEALMYAAPGVQTSSNRWGDYSSMTVDPSDDCTFWYTQEYYAANASSTFSTRVGKFKFPGCTAAPKGTISGTITSCSTGLPVAAANVTASGGFQRLTAANGTYTMTVTPGTYTVGADKLSNGYLGSSTNVTVTNGGTATANICMSAVPILSQGSSAIVSESCGLPNQSPDPGENITVSLAIANNGGADTTNLTATLQNTGGVTNAGPAQSYGAIPIGGSPVTKNFTFTVNPSTTCGSPITLTWNISDGATNYGTMTKSFGTGAPVVNLTQNFDSVTAPALPSGWVQNQLSGTGITFVTSTTTPSSAPNAAFANDPAGVNDTALESPVFPVSVTNASLTFKKAFTTESGFDGAVLEIKIGSGAWQDIVTAGGTFVSGGYNGSISTAWGSTIGGRQAWTGSSASYTTSQVTLPAAANGQNVQLRWRMASDQSVSSTGFRVDDIQVTAGVHCESGCGGNPVTGHAPFDFDGDGKTDVSIFRAGANAEWWISRSSSTVLAAQFGTTGDQPAPADYTGDGKSDMAFFRPSNSTWYILRSEDFSFYGFQFGSSTDVPAPADYDGDGKADAAVFRSGTWFIVRSTDNGVTTASFGVAGDKPVPADFDGDGKADIGVFRPNGGTGGEWWIQRSTAGLLAATFGSSTDKTVVGDWTGDGKADCAFFRPSNNTWYVLRSEDFSFFGFPFGNPTDSPAPGDYDGDGKTDAAVFRQPGAQWFVNKSSGGVTSLSFGSAGDQPVPGSFVR
jgi:hypothetical protein